MMPCHHLSIARLKTNSGKYSWLNYHFLQLLWRLAAHLLNLPRRKNVESPPWNVRKHVEFCVSLLEILGLRWIKWDHKSFQASNHQQLQDDSPVKEQWQEITRNLDYIWWPVWQKSRTCTLRTILVWNFQCIRELNYLIVELRWVAQAPTC